MWIYRSLLLPSLALDDFIVLAHDNLDRSALVFDENLRLEWSDQLGLEYDLTSRYRLLLQSFHAS
jgi:hypothetical protein